MESSLATEPTKTAIENLVAGVVTDKLSSTAAAIATKKFLTGDNRLIYLTQCSVSESSVPRVRVQVFERVEGGVHETSFALFADHRFERTENAMIFGQNTAAPVNPAPSPVDEATGQWIIQLVNSLPSAQPVL